MIRMWYSWNSHMLLVNAYIGTNTSEIGLEVSTKAEHKHIPWFFNSTSGYMPNKNVYMGTRIFISLNINIWLYLVKPYRHFKWLIIEWMNKLWYIHRVGIYTTTTMNTQMLHIHHRQTSQTKSWMKASKQKDNTVWIHL